MKMIKILAAVVLVIVPMLVFAQQPAPADALLNRLTGKWILKGVIDGKNIQHDIIAEWVLGHQYLQLKETSDEKTPNGDPSYDAIVLNNKLMQYDCLWLDNTSNGGLSNGVIAHTKFKANTLALLFKFSDKSYFHTTFIFNPTENSWHWKMESDENGKIEPFADAEMSKME